MLSNLLSKYIKNSVMKWRTMTRNGFGVFWSLTQYTTRITKLILKKHQRNIMKKMNSIQNTKKNITKIISEIYVNKIFFMLSFE